MSEQAKPKATAVAVDALSDEVANMIADWYGRSVIQSDRDLAKAIMARLTGADDEAPDYRDPTYGWHVDELA